MSRPDPQRIAASASARSIRYVAAPAAEIPPGARKIVDLGGRSIGVFNVNGRYYAIRNRCPHQGGPLCLGTLTGLTKPRFYERLPPEIEFEFDCDGKIIRCPWHAWEFDLRTGQAVFGHGIRVAAYDAYLAGEPPLDPDFIAPKGFQVPPPVETYTTSVESGYVVVEMRS